MNLKKMVVVDLDGTLLNSNGNVSKESIEYLKNIKDSGDIIVIATGRILSSAIDITNQAIFANYIISDTGSAIYNMDEKKFVFKKTISKTLVNDIFDFLINYIDFIDYIDICDECYYNKYTNQNHKDSRVVKIIKDIKSFLLTHEETIHIGVDFIDNTVVKDILKALKEKFNDLDFNLMQDSFSDKQSIEIISKNISKYSSIDYLGNLENIENSNIIAFGDGLNDLEMITKCGVGVAMGNALDEIKKASDYITLSNDDNGIIEFLKKF